MPWYEEFDRAAAARLPALEIRCEEPMSRHTTFRVGGPARRMAFPGTEEELLVHEIDLDEILEIRSRIPYINDFKEDTFSMDALKKY